MIFKKYRSMENSYRTKFMNKIIEQGFTSNTVLWVATEKVHGANSGLWVDDKEVRISKKTSLINDKENFYKADVLLKKYKDDARIIFDNLRLSIGHFKSLTIWGELYGGSYPHPDVPKDNNSKKVQKGIFYNPSNDLLIFDIMITDEDNKDSYLTSDAVIELIGKTKLETVPELARGTFDEMIKFQNDGQSVVHKIYGLPTIEDNIMEGVVLKPIIASFLHDGSRVIVKNKNDKWSEKANAPKRQPKIINEAIKPIVEEIGMYVTENRLHNVLSHIGEVTNRDFGLINKEFITDVMKDYLEENSNDALNVLNKKDRKLVSKNVGKQTAQLIRANFLNILDNEY